MLSLLSSGTSIKNADDRLRSSLQKRKRGGDGSVPSTARPIEGATIDPSDVDDSYGTIASDADALALRKRLRINVTDEDVDGYGLCRPITDFSSLSAGLRRRLDNIGVHRPTATQVQSMPLLTGGRDVLVCAPTGSGKTLAYLLPILHRLAKHESGSGYRAVIVSPTRELAAQIHDTLKVLTRYSRAEKDRMRKRAAGTEQDRGVGLRVNLLTKSNEAVQAQAHADDLGKGYDVLVTTPLRLVHAVESKTVDLSSVTHLVLDEADRLFESGFVHQTDALLAALPSRKGCVRCLFSATLPSGVEQLARTVMRSPVRVIVGRKDAAAELVRQRLVFVGDERGKLMTLRQMTNSGGLVPPALVFVQSIDRAKQLHVELSQELASAASGAAATTSGDGERRCDVIHAELPQASRDAAVASFRAGRTWVLITTELLSRGLDFPAVSVVVNYDFPQSVQSYIHRVGRAGRAGVPGSAVTFFTKDDAPYLKSVASVVRASGGEVADWMLDLRAPSKPMKKKLRQKPVDRKPISKTAYAEHKAQAHRKDIIRNSVIRKRRLEKEGGGQRTAARPVADDEEFAGFD